MRRLVAAVALAGLTLSVVTLAPPAAVAAAAPAGDTTEPASVPDELLVGYAAGSSARDRAAARSRAGARLVSVVVPEAAGRAVVELVATPAGGRGQSERRFEADRKVAYAEPNWVYQHTAISDDPLYTGGNLWGMYGDATTPANPYGSQAAEAWAAGNTGSDAVYVGVIDEGIQIEHPDLASNIWTNQFDAADGEDNDGNGYVDDVNGWDFAGNDSSVYDGTGDDHGTHVAGTIGAQGGNGAGVAGVAWNVTLIPAKFLGEGGGTTANAVKAVDYLTNLKTRHGINLVATSNSWGGGGYSSTLLAAIERAKAADILFVAAAGNAGKNADKWPHYPSSYNSTNIVSVASIDASGNRSSFSNYGASSVDLGAPGSSIVSTLPDGRYGAYSGTSMATPHVTGAAVLYAHWKPGSSAAAIKAALLSATIPTSSMSGITVSDGRLDAGGFGKATVGEDIEPPAAPTEVQVSSTGSRGELTVSWKGNIEPDLSSYLIHRTGVTDPVQTVDATATSWTETGLADSTSYSYSVTAVDVNGNKSAASATAAGTTSAYSAPETGGLTLTATGYKQKGLQKVDLTWTGGEPSEDVTITRSGSSNATFDTANDGAVTDHINAKGGGSYEYTICQNGRCSAAPPVVF